MAPCYGNTERLGDVDKGPVLSLPSPLLYRESVESRPQAAAEEGETAESRGEQGTFGS
jgi:hypothetical protein